MPGKSSPDLELLIRLLKRYRNARLLAQAYGGGIGPNTPNEWRRRLMAGGRLSVDKRRRLEELDAAPPTPPAPDQSSHMQPVWRYGDRFRGIELEPIHEQGQPYPTRSWQADLAPVLAGTPLEGALGRLPVKGRVDLDQKWRELTADRRANIEQALRAMAALALVIGRTVPENVAERLNDVLEEEVQALTAALFD